MLLSLSMYITNRILLECVDLLGCITSRCSGLVRYCITQETVIQPSRSTLS